MSNRRIIRISGSYDYGMSKKAEEKKTESNRRVINDSQSNGEETGNKESLYYDLRNISENYKTPPIPDGYRYVEGHWKTGFIIERISDESRFTWVPVGFLDEDGTLDGKTFNQKFGRINFQDEKFSNDRFHEDLPDELMDQRESIETYGGFYISTFDISKGADGKPQSKQGKMSWVYVNFTEVKQIASSFENSFMLKSHLPYGVEMDSMYSWFIKSGTRIYDEVAYDSTAMGNHWNSEGTPREVIETGSREEWFTNGIADPTGNVNEWTQEKRGSSCRVIRGGCYCGSGNDYPVVHRSPSFPQYNCGYTGFRIVLYISINCHCTYIEQ